MDYAINAGKSCALSIILLAFFRRNTRVFP